MKKYPLGRLKTKEYNDIVVFGQEQLFKCSVDAVRSFKIGGTSEAIQVRTDGEFANKGFWLNANFDYHIIEDSEGCLVLVPVRKKVK